MPKRYVAGCRHLRQVQVQFIRRLERGDAAAGELLKELGISSTSFGQWLQTPVFARRYQRALKQVQARAASVEVAALLREAQKRLAAEGAGGKVVESPTEPVLDRESPLGQRLIDLHGSEIAAIQKIKDADESR